MGTMITEKMKEEILMLCSHLAYNDAVTAYDIMRIIKEGAGDDYSYHQLLGILYKYGKMEGIRLERERKKALANPKIS